MRFTALNGIDEFLILRSLATHTYTYCMKQQNATVSFSKSIILSLFIGVLGYLGGILSSNKFQQSTVTQPYVPVNITGVTLPYFTSQIQAPRTYFATPDTMIESYLSQGGMAPPRLILMKGYQVSGKDTEYLSAIKNPTHDCIVIWSTNGLNTIADWNQIIPNTQGIVSQSQEIIIGNRKAQIHMIQKNEGNILVGLLNIGNSDKTSYFFHTCNVHNKQDFTDIIRSIKFRDDEQL